jgi:predicted  nucleic acid-binding Zn-ribbon protein
VIKNKNSRIESLRQDVGDLEHHLELQNSSNLDLTRERFRLNKELKNVKSELGDLKNIQEKLELDLFEARTRRLASEEEQDSIHSQNMRALHKKYKQDRRAKKDSTIRHIIDVINYLPARTSETSNKIKRMYACIAKLATDFEIDMGNSKEYLEKLLNFQMSSVDFTRYISDTLNQQIIGST